MKNLTINIILLFFINSCAGELANRSGLLDGDLDQPVVVKVTPLNQLSNVASDTSIVLTFSKEMDTIQTSNEFSLSSSTGLHDGFYFWDNSRTVLTFTPKDILGDNDTYTISVTSNAEDINGNDLKESFTSVFYVNSDLLPPEILSYTPANDITGILPGSNIVITFSEPVDLNTLYNGITVSPAVTGSYSWNANNTIITFDPLYDMSYGTSYTVTVAESIKDLSGNPLAEQLNFNFTVGDDFLKPGLSVSQPLTSATLWQENIINTGVEKDNALQIYFTEVVNTSELYSAISITPDVNYYLTDRIIGTQTRVNIVFTEAMTSEQIFTLSISTTITDLQNNSLDKEYIFRYYTDGPNSIAPTVVSIDDPSAGIWTMGEIVTLGFVNPFPNIKIIFSTDMVAASMDVSIEKTVGSGISLPRIMNPDWPAWPLLNEYSFDLTGILASNTYKITVKGGIGGAQDTNGNFLKQDFVQYIRF